MTEECIACGSEEVVRSELRSDNSGRRSYLCPGTLKWFKFVIHPGVRVDGVLACLHCGAFWGRVNSQELRSFRDKHCGGADP